MTGPSAVLTAAPMGVRGTLAELSEGESAGVVALDLPDAIAQRLMELGFLAGCRVTALRPAPGGDPRVFEVDGSEVALRRETARRIHVEIER